MDKKFKEASWIWYTETPEADTYGDFIDKVLIALLIFISPSSRKKRFISPAIIGTA